MLRKPRMYDTDVASFQSGLDCSGDPSRAQQNMADQCDINNLVQLYARTGQVPGSDLPGYTFAVDEIFDFQTAMNQIRASQEAFADLPANIRDRFQNDPARFLDFVQDESNRPEAERLGLVSPRPSDPPVPTPAPAAVVPPTQSDPT